MWRFCYLFKFIWPSLTVCTNQTNAKPVQTWEVFCMMRCMSDFKASCEILTTKSNISHLFEEWAHSGVNSDVYADYPTVFTDTWIQLVTLACIYRDCPEYAEHRVYYSHEREAAAKQRVCSLYTCLCVSVNTDAQQTSQPAVLIPSCSCVTQIIFICRRKEQLDLKEDYCFVISLSPGDLGVSHLSLWAVLWSTVNQTTANCWHLDALESWMGTRMRVSSLTLFSENRGQKKTWREPKCSS